MCITYDIVWWELLHYPKDDPFNWVETLQVEHILEIYE